MTLENVNVHKKYEKIDQNFFYKKYFDQYI